MVDVRRTDAVYIRFVELRRKVIFMNEKFEFCVRAENTESGWMTNSGLTGKAPKIVVADIIASVLRRHDESVAQMVAMAILTGNPIPSLNIDRTVIDMSAFAKGDSE